MSSTNFTANIAEVSLTVSDELISTTSAYKEYYLNIYNNYFFTIENPNPNTYFGVANQSFSTLSKNHITASNMSQGCFHTGGKDTSAYFVSGPLNLKITINSASQSYETTFSYPIGSTGSSSAVPPPYNQIYSSENNKAFDDPTYTQQIARIYIPYVQYNTKSDKEKDIGKTGVYYCDPDQTKTVINMTFYIIEGRVNNKQFSLTASQISGKTLVDGKKKEVFMLLQWSDATNPYTSDDTDINFSKDGRWLFYSPETLKKVSKDTVVLTNISEEDLVSVPSVITAQEILQALLAPNGNVPKTSVIGILYFSVLDELLPQDIQIKGVVLYDLQANTNTGAICTGLPSFTACKI